MDNLTLGDKVYHDLTLLNGEVVRVAGEVMEFKHNHITLRHVKYSAITQLQRILDFIEIQVTHERPDPRRASDTGDDGC